MSSEGLKQNAELAKKVAGHALEFYGVSQKDVDAHAAQLTRDGKSSDHTSVSQALKHFVRDWSEDGMEERNATFPQILEILQNLFLNRSDKKPMKVLVPGSGVGRLAHAIDDLTGRFSPFLN